MRRPSVLSALLLAGGLLLTGCGGDEGATTESDGSSPSTTQDAGGSGGDEPTSDQSGDDGNGTEFEMGSLPDDFPEDDVPLADGEIVTAVSTPGVNGGFAATLKVDGPFEDAFDEALSKLEDAGFTVESRDTIGGYQASRLTSDDYLVVVTGGETDGQAALIYTIQPAQ
jgi:hypothetical protein